MKGACQRSWKFCRCTQWMLGEGLGVGVRGHVNVRVRCRCTQWMLR